ncbi:LysR family transcriptional regulator [Variovorax sp. LjRoot178]|uniref:LysR family transcriptional regulator n=1 Tax=Variovorax sp. LjRoot178 TaxID=3342277 RepID=UPI003ECC4FEA
METIDRQLRYFVKIAESGSLSRAAAGLEITQPVLSRQLASLEAFLQCILFNRTGRGMQLTECGQALLGQIAPAFSAIDTAVNSARNQQLKGTLRLATVHTLSYYFVGEVVRTFTDRHPAVSLSVMGRSSPDVVELVESGRADVGIVYDTAVASHRLSSTRLFDNKMCLICGPGCDASDGVDLTEQLPSLVGFPSHYALTRMIHSSGLKPEFVAEAETVDAMLELVSAGMGACILPQRIPSRQLSQHGLRKVAIGKPAMSRMVVLITREDRNHSALTRRFLETALEVAKTTPDGS